MKNLTLWELYDSLCQRHGKPPVCRRAEINSLIRNGDEDDEDEEEKKSLNFILSTDGMKRDGNTVDQSGWLLENYLKNPVVLFAHDRTALPVGKGTKIRKSKGNLIGTCEFVDFSIPEIGPKSEALYRLYKDGIMSATSVGFKALDAVQMTEDEIEAELKKMKQKLKPYYGGIRFTKMDLLEYSLVPVPADPDALQKRCQSDGSLADILVLPRDYSKREIELEDGKYGLMHLDGSAPEVEEKTIIDMGAINHDLCEDCGLFDDDFVAERAQKKGSKVQSLIFSKDVFKDAASAKSWAKGHDFRSDKVDETENSFRLRQFDPSKCDKETFGTISITKGVQGTVCVPKSSENKEVEEVEERTEEFDSTRIDAVLTKLQNRYGEKSPIILQRYLQGYVQVSDKEDTYFYNWTITTYGENNPVTSNNSLVYQNLHGMLENAQDETIKKSLQDSIVTVGKQLFGEHRQLESWELPEPTEIHTAIRASVDQLLVLNESQADSDDIDFIVNNIYDTINTKMLDKEVELASLQTELDAITDIVREAKPDFNSETDNLVEVLETLVTEKAEKTREADLEAALERITKKLPKKQEVVEKTYESVIDRVLKSVEARKASKTDK